MYKGMVHFVTLIAFGAVRAVSGRVSLFQAVETDSSFLHLLIPVIQLEVFEGLASRESMLTVTHRAGLLGAAQGELLLPLVRPRLMPRSFWWWRREPGSSFVVLFP